ncbi:MAG TPA: AMP-binding protein, partial [Longimicrobiales bacterium]|nr:AMP-binding protein [Longimicrobiales bacterium]
SVPLLLQEVFAFYEAGCRGETLKLEQPRPFRDYIVWLKQQDMSRAEAYWRQALAGFTTPTRLSLARTAANGESGYGEEQVRLSAEQSEQVQRFAREQQVTVNTVVQGAWALLLSRYSGEEEVLFGATVSGRPAELAGVEQMVGLFINSLPVRVRVSGEAQVGPWLRALQSQVMELRQYEYSPLVEVQGWSDVKRGQNLFETLVVFEDYPVAESLSRQKQSVKLEQLRISEQNSFALTLLSAANAWLRLSYDRQVYEASTVKRLLHQLQTLVLGMVSEPGQRLRSLPLLGADERQQLLVEWNATTRAYAAEQCIDELFAAQVKRTPEAAAIIFGEQQLTYAELEGRAHQLGHHLQQLGVGAEVKVGVLMERSLEMMIAVLGIVKAGAAYVPLDPNYPAERLSFMLADAAVEVLITQAALAPRLPAHAAHVLCWERDWEGIAEEPKTTPARRATADNLLYVIYTSGSTGQPKGVAMTHRGVYQLLSWQAGHLALEAGQRTLQMASLSFDVSFQEIFTTWCSGGTLVLLSEAERRDSRKLLAYIKAAGIARLFLPFVALQQVAE